MMGRRFNRTEAVLKRAGGMGLDLEEISFRNLVVFHVDKLRGLHERGIDGFNTLEKTKLRKRGVLVARRRGYPHRRVMFVSERAERVLKER